MENQVQTFVIFSSAFLIFFILFTVYLIVKLKLHDLKLKKSEADLRELNQSLQNIVQERTKELHQSETQFRTLYEQHREVLDNSPAGIIKINANLAIEYANPEMNTILVNASQRYDLLQGRFIRDIALFGNSDLQDFFQELKTGFELSKEIEIAGKNKKMITVIVKGVPIIENDIFLGAVIVVNDVSEIKEIQTRLTASLQEKELLLKEINHRVKNNMQIIGSMLKLQQRYIDDPDIKRLTRNSLDRVKTMSLVHEKLYYAADLSKINFGDYVKSIAIYLFGSYGIRPSKVKLDINIENIFMEISTAIPCGLIINELISNALKHAFPDDREGIIRVELLPTEKDKYLLTVSDNGIGFPEKINLENAETLGLMLTKTLVEQLHGNMRLVRNEWTTFIIEYKNVTLSTFSEVKNKNGTEILF
ncbi:MAG: PAS domain-containing protein [Candidatus Cloacimonetes bacterium]|nr:PAS domain-containing protein [Candidatus Cloacimonadota bacterium]